MSEKWMLDITERLVRIEEKVNSIVDEAKCTSAMVKCHDRQISAGKVKFWIIFSIGSSFIALVISKIL